MIQWDVSSNMYSQWNERWSLSSGIYYIQVVIIADYIEYLSTAQLKAGKWYLHSNGFAQSLNCLCINIFTEMWTKLEQLEHY